MRYFAGIGLAALLLLMAVPAAADPGSGIRVMHMPAGHANVWVRWQADVRGPHGEFLVLRGSDPGSLRVVARVSAHGPGEYGVMDLSGASGPRVYQLRYLDPRGVVHLLASQEVLVESPQLQPTDLWTVGAPQPDVTLSQSERLPGHDRSGVLYRSPAARSAAPAGPQPPTPPPRSA